MKIVKVTVTNEDGILLDSITLSVEENCSRIELNPLRGNEGERQPDVLNIGK